MQRGWGIRSLNLVRLEMFVIKKVKKKRGLALVAMATKDAAVAAAMEM